MAFYDPSAFLTVNPALLFIIVIWTVVWKGLALWRAAHKEAPIWFVILLIINTVGILEILYLFIFSKTGKKEARPAKKAPKKKVKKRKK